MPRGLYLHSIHCARPPEWTIPYIEFINSLNLFFEAGEAGGQENNGIFGKVSGKL